MATELPSIVDVAARAQVSVATASRVMSSSSYPVSEATRQKVQKAAEELNYEPNSLARSLKAQRSRLIAVIVGDSSDPYFAQVVRGVEEIANESGYLTIVCNTDRNMGRELSYLQTLQDYRIDGAIFTASGLTDPDYTQQQSLLIQKMTRRGAAVIALAPHGPEFPAIVADNVGAARTMASHLISLGHRKIAFITGPNNVTAANERLAGYKMALEDANISPIPTLFLPGNFHHDGGEKAASSIIQLSEQARPTAIFAANDEMAIGLMFELQRQHIKIPGQISICGFGDIPIARAVIPSLTTMSIGLRELGRAGATKLLALLNKETVPLKETIAPIIVIRDSTAPPAIVE